MMIVRGSYDRLRCNAIDEHHVVDVVRLRRKEEVDPSTVHCYVGISIKIAPIFSPTRSKGGQGLLEMETYHKYGIVVSY